MQIMPWHESAWQKLQHNFTSKLPHALLFTGPQGIGKADFVTSYAQSLLCLTPVAGHACRQCRACHLYSKATHPDALLFGQKEPISIDDVREIISFLTQSAHLGSQKIVVLLNIESIQPAAGNALLKTLEEPTKGSHLFLTCQNEQILLPTIKSRCVIFPMALPEKSVAYDWLVKAHPTYSAQMLNTLLTLAGGAPLKAQQLIEEGYDEKAQTILFDAFFGAPTVFPSNLVTNTTNVKLLLQLLCYYVTDTIRGYYSIPMQICQAPFQYKIAVQDLFLFYDKIQEALESLHKIPSLNKQLMLEHLFYEWYQLIH